MEDLGWRLGSGMTMPGLRQDSLAPRESSRLRWPQWLAPDYSLQGLVQGRVCCGSPHCGCIVSFFSLCFAGGGTIAESLLSYGDLLISPLISVPTSGGSGGCSDLRLDITFHIRLDIPAFGPASVSSGPGGPSSSSP